MDYIAYFKLQAKNLFKDYKTKKPFFDKVIDDFLYEYTPQFFDMDSLVCDFDINEDNFSLMKAQHLIAYMAGFRKWTDLVKSSDTELELGKLLFDNQDKTSRDDWDMYIAGIESDNNNAFDIDAKLEIFKAVVLNWKVEDNSFSDYRLKKRYAQH